MCSTGAEPEAPVSSEPLSETTSQDQEQAQTETKFSYHQLEKTSGGEPEALKKNKK